jgi:ribosomal protein S18 acetylase RimI-like enzyme
LAPDPGREIVAVSHDGRIAGFAVTWFDARNRVGHFEPVGTHRDFRRLGLAGAVTRHAMAEMRRYSLTTITVNHNAENIAAAQLYVSLGFIRRHETFGYRRGEPLTPET